MHRRNNCDRVMSCLLQIKSAARSIDVGIRNATNRSGRSPTVDFTRFRLHPHAFSARRKWSLVQHRAVVAHIVRIVAGSARDHFCRGIARRQSCIPLHFFQSHPTHLTMRGSGDYASLLSRPSQAICLWFCDSGATCLLISSMSIGRERI